MEFCENQFSSTIAWFFTCILLPLTPFFLVAIINLIYFENLSWTIFDPTILSFAMIMLCYVALVKIHNLDNNHLKSVLTTIYYLIIAFLFVPFVLSVFLNIETASSINILLDNFRNNNVNSQMIIQQLQNISTASEQYQHHLGVIRLFVLSLAGFTVMFSIICKWRWKIGSGIYGE
jgi:hypothetical protein